jgi:hypothetical protein
MFTETTYNALTIPFPAKGVNTTVTPQGLPLNFAQHLENIIPSKEGTGSVRNGTKLLHPIQTLGDDSVILETFPYAKKDGTNQLLVYVLNYKDDAANDMEFKDKNNFTFTTSKQAYYVEDAPIRITYKQDLVSHIIHAYVKKLHGNKLTFYGDEFPEEPPQITAISYAVGAIYSFDESTGNYSLLEDDLANVCIPRYTQHAGELFICNGVDDNYRWDGATLQIVKDKLEDVSNSLKWKGQDTFEFDITQTTNINHYQVGTKVFLVATLHATKTDGNQKVSSLTQAGAEATLTLTEDHNFPIGTLVSISGANETTYNKTINISAGRVTANTFKYDVAGNQNPPATGNVTVDAVEYQIEGTVETVTQVGNKLQIKLNKKLLPGFEITLNKLSYEVTVPPFSYVYAAHDRIWALGAGVPHPTRYRPQETAMRVYFTQFNNSITQWFKQSTQTVPSIEMSGKHLVADNLEGMRVINGGMAFFGREHTQIWTGIDPVPDENNDVDFIWYRTIPVGCVHGNLIQSLPNDAAFISKYGERTLSSVNIAQQFATGAEMGASVDKTVLDYVNVLMTNPLSYRQARSWIYSTTLGFKFGRLPLIYNLTNIAQGWVFFSGDFELARTYATDHQGRLILAIKNKLYRYADGQIENDTLNWADDDGKGAITWAWFSPWIKPGRGRWANKRFELIMTPSEQVPISIFYALNGNLGVSYDKDIKTNQEGGYWGQAIWNKGLWGSNYKNPEGRLKFVGSTFLIGIKGTTNKGPVDIFKLRLYGEAER